MDSNAIVPEPPPYPEPPPGRPAWEVAALFLGIALALFLWWRLQQGDTAARASALSQTLKAERSVDLVLAMPGGRARAPEVRWETARQEYRRALNVDPRLPRARRGLAALEYMLGNHAEAARLMKHPSDTPTEMQDVWRAFQMAFGAVPKPNEAELPRYRQALEKRNLGWSRFVALKALAAAPQEAERWEKALHGGEGGSGRWRPAPFRLGVGLAVLLALPFGVRLLVRYVSSPPPDRLTEVHAPVGAMLMVAAVSVLVAQAPILFVRFALVPGGAEPSNGQLVGIMALGAALGVAVMFPVADRLLRVAGGNVRELGWNASGLFRWSAGGYLTMLPLLFAAAIASGALDKLFANTPTPDNPAAGMAAIASGPMFLMVLLFAAVAVPILEEFVMRGLLFRALSKRYGMGIGMVASSFLFAGLHPQLPAGFPPLFVIGLGLCAVYRASGSLLPAMVIHGVSNGIVLVIARFALT